MATVKPCKNLHRSPSPAQCMEHYGCIYENNHLITLLVDPESGGITDANRAACEFYGYSIRQFRQLRICDLAADRTSGVQEFVEKALPEGADGKNRVFIDRHILAGGGAHRCGGSYRHDDDARQELRIHRNSRYQRTGPLGAASQRKRGAVQGSGRALPGAHSGLQRGTILFANKQTERMFGNPKQELIGRRIEDFFNEVYFQSAEHNKLKTTGQLKERFRIEQRLIRRQDNRIFDLEISGVPVIYDETKALQLVFRDITESKREMERAVRLQEHRHEVSFPLFSKAVLEKLYIPARTLSGDFFIFHKVNEEQVIGFIGDVTGKGITAALNISALRVLFMDSLSCTQDPLQVLNDLNSKALLHLGEDYVAGCCFLFDFKTGRLKAAGAGINEFLYVPRDRGIERITVKGLRSACLRAVNLRRKPSRLSPGTVFASIVTEWSCCSARKNSGGSTVIFWRGLPGLLCRMTAPGSV